MCCDSGQSSGDGGWESRLRVLSRTLVAATMLLTAVAASPPGVQGVACTGTARAFMGVRQTPPTAPKGTAATIQKINYDLCTGSTGTFSSAWVALVKPTNENNIYQIGFDKCVGDQCAPTSAVNIVYAFVAYGRQAGACGAIMFPTPVAVSYSPVGMPRFKIEKTSDGLEYRAYIDNFIEDSRPSGDLDTCWSGVSSSDVFNEVLSTSQSGGRVGDKQDFDDVRYKTGVWNLLTRPLGATCDVEQLPTQRCVTHSGTSNYFYMWDTRYP